LEGAEHGRKLHPQQVNGTEAREKPHTLAEYAMDHFRWVMYLCKCWVPLGAGNFSPHHCIQTNSGAHPDSYPMGTRGSFPKVKLVGAWRWPLTSI